MRLKQNKKTKIILGKTQKQEDKKMIEFFNFVNAYSTVLGSALDFLLPDFIQDIYGDILTSIAPQWNDMVALFYGIVGL